MLGIIYVVLNAAMWSLRDGIVSVGKNRFNGSVYVFMTISIVGRLNTQVNCKLNPLCVIEYCGLFGLQHS